MRLKNFMLSYEADKSMVSQNEKNGFKDPFDPIHILSEKLYRQFIPGYYWPPNSSVLIFSFHSY